MTYLRTGVQRSGPEREQLSVFTLGTREEVGWRGGGLSKLFDTNKVRDVVSTGHLTGQSQYPTFGSRPHTSSLEAYLAGREREETEGRGIVHPQSSSRQRPTLVPTVFVKDSSDDYRLGVIPSHSLVSNVCPNPHLSGMDARHLRPERF